MTPAGKDDSTGRLWIEEGESRVGLVAQVAPLLPVHRPFHYAVPDELADRVVPGLRVRVPVGRGGRLVEAFVLSVDEGTWDSTLSPIAEFVDNTAFLTAELIALGLGIAEHYQTPLGRTLKAMTPEAVRQGRGMKLVRYVEAVRVDEEAAPRMTPQRRAVLEALAAADGPQPLPALAKAAAVSDGVIRGLAKAGRVRIFERREAGEAAEAGGVIEEPSFKLNEEQRSAIEAIGHRLDRGEFHVTLLHGVSGSGKTEVYIRAIRRAIAAGRQAILLVPEIVLTTQLVERLAARFEHVAVHHSGLSEVQRSLLWRETASGQRQLVIGTRSAVFAPCPSLGLIIVDEEQETSYKNMQAPRFHVRDVAVLRGSLAGIPVVLGSATPSIETWYNAEHKPHYDRISLARRVMDLPLPQVMVVDMREEYRIARRQLVVSRHLQKALDETLARNEQAVILLNRRGYAHRLMCPICRSAVNCPRCKVSLVVHAAAQKAICHRCHRRYAIPETCPDLSCQGVLSHTGVGTQRAEEILMRLYPQARIRRVDSDTMRHQRDYEAAVEAFTRRKIDVVVGTQMIAKGLDFPGVSLVGVLQAEPSAAETDFRSGEYLFQLITQVAGRAGRAADTGRVIVQTNMIEHPVFRFALSHDYESFAGEELEARERSGMPPFCRLCRVVTQHEREETARKAAIAWTEQLAERIDELDLRSQADVLGPTPCAIARIRGKYRYELLLRTQTVDVQRRLVASMRERGWQKSAGATAIVDVDPVELT